MRRALIATSLIVLLVAWAFHPLGGGASERVEAAAALPKPATQPSDVVSPYVDVRGTPGFWRLGETHNGIWWFVSPTGQNQFLNTVTTVQPFQYSRQFNGVSFISRDWDGKHDDSDYDRWAEATLKRVEAYGFKGLGAWCHPAFHKLDVPMSQDLNLWAWINDASRRLYATDWQTMAEQAVKIQVVPLKNNRNLVGYFIDNELDWGDGFAGPGAYFDHLSPTDPNRREVMVVIHQLWPSLSDFNLAWDTKVTDWSQLDTWPTLPREQARAYDRLGSAWLSHLANDYFRITATLIHKYDPNHLILGVRFKGTAPREVVRASRDYTDAQSLNYYVADAQLDPDMFRMMYQQSHQPIIISEYSFHSLDGSSGNPDTVGFSAQVPDQQARAEGYRLMTTRLARVPYIVGADWFQWCDEPPAGRGGDGEDVNFGIVDVHDKPYTALVDAVRRTTPLLNPLHEESWTDKDSDVWRPSYANKPVMHVPYLARSPIANGTFVWPNDARVPNIRCCQTVGLEREGMTMPAVYLGWTRAGLYLGMDVPDKQIATAPATGWWWTRDNAEIWISTRPVSSDQNRYDVYCHQFFFVPPMPGIAASTAVAGRWHREGDDIKDNIIPEPEIKSVVRTRPGGYAFAMFIPAAALHGYDPIHQPAMAFNVNVRDFHAASDYFWSAPKQTETQLRPDTWGTLYLDSPPAEVLSTNAQARAE